MSFSQLIRLTVLYHILFRIYFCFFFFFLSSSLLSLSSIPNAFYYPPFFTLLLSAIPHTSYCLPFHTPFLFSIIHTFYYPPFLILLFILYFSQNLIIFYSSHLLLSSILHTSYPIISSPTFFPHFSFLS
jgi:hypothetical protein